MCMGRFKAGSGGCWDGGLFSRREATGGESRPGRRRWGARRWVCQVLGRWGWGGAARPVARSRSWWLALPFGRLGLIPQPVHLGQRHFAEGAAAALGGLLHIGKPLGEAVSGAAQRLLRIHFHEPSKVHQREQEIADFRLESTPGLVRGGLRRLGPCVGDFAELLVDLADDLVIPRLVVRPVEADAGCPHLQLVGAQERRQGFPDAVERRAYLAVVGLPGLLLPLDLFPAVDDLLGGLYNRRGVSSFAEHMRVAADELLSQGLQHVLDSEGLPLTPDLGVKEYLKQHVAQLLFDLCLVLLLYRFEDLVGLFDQVRLERLAGLLAVPGAAAFPSQPRHDLDDVIEPC